MNNKDLTKKLSYRELSKEFITISQHLLKENSPAPENSYFKGSLLQARRYISENYDNYLFRNQRRIIDRVSLIDGQVTDQFNSEIFGED